MKIIQLRDVQLGDGDVKLCVPLTGTDIQSLLEEAKEAKASPAHIAEWRVDYFAHVFDTERVMDTLKALRDALGSMPLLFTFRTAEEGGVSAMEKKLYLALTCKAAQSGDADAVDVELFSGDDGVRDVIQAAHEHHTAVVVSSHDFYKTPKKEILLSRFEKMRALGGDIPKIAVMPEAFPDVLELMGATAAYAKTADCPVIAMSMGRLGIVSRIAGQFFGSALTFGSLRRASAPGQMDVETLQYMVRELQK